MGSNSASNGGGGRTDAGPKRTTAYKKGVGNINEKGQKTKTTFTPKDDIRDNNKVVVPKKKTDFKIFDESGCGNHLLKFNAKWY